MGYNTENVNDLFNNFPVQVNVVPSILAKLDSRKPAEVRMTRQSET